MATQRELIYTTKSLLRSGLITDDDKISDRQVAFIHDNIRANLLRRQYDRGQSLSDTHIQNIQCLEVEEVDTSFDPSFNLDCKVFRTSVQIPRVIEAKEKDLLTKISPSEFGTLNYELIPYARVPYARHTKFKRPFAVLYNQYIYLIDAPYTEKINVSGVFEQPNDLSDFTDCSGSNCFDWDSPYPLSSHLIDDLIKLSIEELTIMLKVGQDRTNDATDILDPQGKK